MTADMSAIGALALFLVAGAFIAIYAYHLGRSFSAPFSGIASTGQRLVDKALGKVHDEDGDDNEPPRSMRA